MQLNPGDKVGIISPSSFLRNREDIELGLDYLRSLGFEVIIGDHVYDQDRYMAGTVQNRIADIHKFYADPQIKAIFSTAGGTGSQYLLPQLDYELIKSNPKPLFGFSDVTALQLGIYAQTGSITGTGFTLRYDFKSGHIDGLVEASLKSILNGEKQVVQGGQTVNSGQAEGVLIGGCMSLLRNLCGTPYYPNLTDAILLLEDVGEKTYKIDIMLQQLSVNAGFDKIKGIIFGQFAAMEQVDIEDGSVDEIIENFAKNYNIPIIKNFPYGHVPSRYVLPIGAKVKFDADTCRLEF